MKLPLHVELLCVHVYELAKANKVLFRLSGRTVTAIILLIQN